MEEDAVEEALFEADSEVIIRCENGKSYSTIVTNGEYALVLSNTLKGEFYGPEWEGSLTIRVVGTNRDFSPSGIVEGSVVWTLAPGEYTAKGVGRFGGGACGAGGMRSFSAFPATSLSRMVAGAKSGKTCTSFKTSKPSLSTFSVGNSGFRHPLSGGSGGKGSGERKKRERSGTESLGSQRIEEVATSGGFKRPRGMAKRGREGPEISTLMAGAKGPSVVKREESLV